MRTIKELLTYVIQNNKAGHDCKILGEGSFSVVWDISGDAYKLTSEMTYEQAANMRAKNNELYKRGVKVPLINDIDIFRANNDATMINLKRYLTRYQGDKLFETLADFAESFEQNAGKYEILGIRQQKIVGKNCFSEIKTNNIQLADRVSITGKNLPAVILEKFEPQLKENLQFFNSIPTKHYQKFIEDGVDIMNHGLLIDNVFGTNFIYAKDGFYYIDLDGLNKPRAITPVTNIFNATVENVCEKVSTLSRGYSEELAKQQLELYFKLWQAIETACENPEVKNMFIEYNKKDNLFKRLYNGAINNVSAEVALKCNKKVQNIDNCAKEMY